MTPNEQTLSAVVHIHAYSSSGNKDVGYYKGCSKTCSASEVSVCNHHNVKCDVSCCSSDYCNGNVPSVRSPSFRRPKTSASLPSLKPSFPRSGLGISRVCYQCPSTDSLKDCNKKRIKITCKYGQPCVTASAHSIPEDNEVLYYKGCATTCVASDVPICSHPNVKCQIDCCHSDLCNKATIHVVSAVTLIFIVRMFFPD